MPVTTVLAPLPIATGTRLTVLARLLHVPPVAVLYNVAASPSHTIATPVIAGGKALTVTVAAVVHPAPSV